MEVVAVTVQQPKKPVQPIKGPAEFQRVAREAMELLRRLEAIESNEKAVKAAIAKKAEADRLPLQLRYDTKMDRLMSYVRITHPYVLKGGDKAEFETDELIVRFHKDGNGTLVVADDAALIAYLWRRPELRHMVKVVRSLASATQFKQWWRANPKLHPPVTIVYRNSILFIRKLSAVEKRAHKKPYVVLERSISQS